LADTDYRPIIGASLVKNYPYPYPIRSGIVNCYPYPIHIRGSIMVQLHRESKKFPRHFRNLTNFLIRRLFNQWFKSSPSREAAIH